MNEDLANDNLDHLDEEQVRAYAEMAQARIAELEAKVTSSTWQKSMALAKPKDIGLAKVTGPHQAVNLWGDGNLWFDPQGVVFTEVES